MWLYEVLSVWSHSINEEWFDGLAEAAFRRQDRPTINDQATAYVCEHYTCKRPVTDPETLAAQLDGA